MRDKVHNTVDYAGKFQGHQTEADPLPRSHPWRATEEEMVWWTAGRVGLFIHFGVAAIKGVELSWGRDLPRPFDLQAVKTHPGEEPQRVPQEEYDTLYRKFNPEQFDADDWVNAAK